MSVGLYMIDGMYQSAVCFFMAYLLFEPANFVTYNGLQINDTKRFGVFVACAAIFVVNVYVLLNTYRWDWLMLLLVSLSFLLIWFWTGVYTATTGSSWFYKAAPQVFGQLSFWALTLLTIAICLAPRFAAKAFQKLYLPLDVDIIREQVRLGKFSYLDQHEAYVPPKMASPASSELSQPLKRDQRTSAVVADDERPIYPHLSRPQQLHTTPVAKMVAMVQTTRGIDSRLITPFGHPSIGPGLHLTGCATRWIEQGRASRPATTLRRPRSSQGWSRAILVTTHPVNRSIRRHFSHLSDRSHRSGHSHQSDHMECPL